MATSTHTSAVKRRQPLLLALALAAVGAVALLIANLGRPPQMGADEAVFNTVDALFTAVTARDEKLLDQCARRLESHKGAKKLPAEAADYLDGVVRQARAGRWESAAETLYAFMNAQRREGAIDHQVRNKSRPGVRPLRPN